jgi:hypothetical protein
MLLALSSSLLRPVEARCQRGPAFIGQLEGEAANVRPSIGRAYPYVAMEPCLDNERDPMDQDSRTSFPDNGTSATSRRAAAAKGQFPQ